MSHYATQINDIFNRMKLNNNHILKASCLISSLATSLLWLVFFIQLFSRIYGVQSMGYFIQHPNIVTYPLFCVFSLIILIKTNSNKGILLFSLFLSLVSQNIALHYFFVQNPQYESYLLTTISFILTSAVYIKSFQNFPQQISASDIDRILPKNRIMRSYLKFSLKKQMWLVFPIVVFILALLFPRNLKMQATVLAFVLATALLFLFVNYKISNPSSRNKISWLLWGILCYTFLTILNSILTYSAPEMQENMAVLFRTLRALSLFISITMCLFFFDTFDTGVLIRRTIVDGVLFIAIVFLYNTIEHYFLHWLSHTMHISNTLISSILSGFFVLIFSPVHHKFMHALDGRFKRKETT